MTEPQTTTELQDQPARYDLLAEGYARHWGPVIRPAAEALLDRLDDGLAAGEQVLDVGTGTGTLAVELLRRWPKASVTGIDAAAAMLELARRDATERLGSELAGRFTTVIADAASLPFESGRFDLAISSFVLQLVRSRVAALREIRRALRPNGRLAWVTWLDGGERFRGDEVVDEVLADFGFDPPEPDGRSGDVASADAAARVTRRAGFVGVAAEPGVLVHRWTPESYTEFIAQFDEQSTFDELEPRERRRVEDRLRGALSRLSPDELTIRLPIVYVTATAGAEARP
ncbi:MAG TPA: methyltransferase domain-containing protein [Candidatus Limnocylindrales bacterium]|nr:methyltransferase domain-containing protein [Candidatus Limnocylindrales bacterium]